MLTSPSESNELMNQLGHDAITAMVFSWFDRCTCPQCGHRSKLKREVEQVERDECCVYVCTACGSTVEESEIEEVPF